MHLRQTLQSSIDLTSETISIDECTYEASMRPDAQEMLTKHCITVIQTKERMIRDALIALGWTPPPEGRVLHSKRKGSDATGA